jgi:hypothetical protein
MKPVVCALSTGLLSFCSAARAEWVLSIYTGTSHTRASDLRIRQPGSGSDATFQSVHWAPRPFEDAPYYGLRISYFPARARHLGGSFELTHYKMYARTERILPVRGLWNGAPVNESAAMSTRVRNLQISHGVNLIGVNANYRWVPAPDADGGAQRWRPHIGAGLVGYGPHAEGSINGISSSGDYQLAGWGAQVFAGTEYWLSRHVSLLIEGKFDAGRLDIDLEPHARAETSVNTLHALGGVAWHF